MQEPLISLVDDDAAVRESLSLLISSVGLRVVAYATPQEFLDSYDPNAVGCLILDIRMPGTSGFSIQDTLNAKEWEIPTIFITGHGDAAQCRRAFQAGAADFLTKPIDEQVLIDSIQKSIQKSISQHQRRQAHAAVSEKLARLSEREHEVCKLIVAGLPNKHIAATLGVAVRTIENHRAAVFEKLEANSLAELVRLTISVENTN